MKKIKLALIGKNIKHSKSKAMYEKILGHEVDYTLIDCDSRDDIPTLKELAYEYMGVSITSPYKEHFLSQVKLEPDSLFAINCLKFEESHTVGTNTDYLAVVEILNRYKKENEIKRIGILGSGVMAKVTKLALKDMDISYKEFSRSQNNMEEIEQYVQESVQNTLLINCCSREYCFKPIKADGYYFWDMNYELEHHQNLFKTLEVNYMDGLELLENQAKYALKVWNLD